MTFIRTLAAALARLIVTVGFFKQANDPNSDNIREFDLLIARLLRQWLMLVKVNITLYVYWGMVECSIAVFAACLPTFRLFSQRWAWSRLGSRARRLFSTPSSSTYFPDLSNEGGIRIERVFGVESNEKRIYASLDDSTSTNQEAQNGARAYATEAPATAREVV